MVGRPVRVLETHSSHSGPCKQCQLHEWELPQRGGAAAACAREREPCFTPFLRRVMVHHQQQRKNGAKLLARCKEGKH